MARAIPREVTNLEKAWLSGILDGEGSIALVTPRSGRRSNGEVQNRVMYGVYFVGAENGWIEKAHDIVNRLRGDEGEPIKLQDKIYKPGVFKSNKKMKQFCIRRQSTLIAFFEAVLPMLTEKKAKAENLYLFLKQRKRFKKVTDEEIKKFVTPVETK